MIFDRKLFATAAILCLILTGCSKGQQSGSTTTTTADQAAPASSSPPQSAVATQAASAMPPSSTPAAPVVAYTDLGGIFGEKEITQLASLGVLGEASGAFDPAKPLTRREFVRWLFKANNSIWAQDSNKLVHPAQGEDSAFTDVKPTDPDFEYIQGLQDSGISVGFPDKTFRPDQPITREQALAIKAALDRGGVQKNYVVTKSNADYGLYNLPDWKDKKTISPEFVGAIATGYQDDRGNANDPARRVDNIERAFGAIAMLKPKAPLTRGQAAIMLWKIGPHSRETDGENARTAADALVPAPSPSASP